MKRNKRIILLAIIVLLGMTALLYTSFGYFNTKIFGNETSKLNTFKNNPLTIVYSDNTNTIVSSEEESFTPGSTITKTFSVTNPGSTSFSYSISLDEITNTFTRTQDITYKISLDGNLLKSGVFPSETEIIIYNQSISAGETLNYVLTIEYINSDGNQIVDSSAEISAKIVFNYAEKGFNNILIYGNSIQNSTPAIDNPVELLSVGERTKNILKTPTGTVTKNGITVTADGKTININGTTPGGKYGYIKVSGDTPAIEIQNGDSYLANYSNEDVVIPAGKIVAFTRYSNNLNIDWIFLTYSDGTVGHVSGFSSYRNSNNYTYTPTKDVTAVWYRYPANYTVDNVTFTNQIEYGAPSEYEPYGYKIKLSKETNNLFHPTQGSITYAGVTITVQDDIITLDGTLTGNGSQTNFVGLTNNFFTHTSVNGYWEYLLSSSLGLNSNNYTIKKHYISSGENNTSGNYPYIAVGYDYRMGNVSSNANEVHLTNKTPKFIELNLGVSDGSITYDNYKMKIMFNEGSTALDYEKPGPILNAYMDEPLRKIGNYTDYLDWNANKIYRNVKEVDLNTTLPKFHFSTDWDNDDYTTCYFYTADKVITFYPISNYFKSLKGYNANVHDNAISSNIENNYIYIKIAKTIATNNSELNTWLSTLSTPVRIYYQLASPEVEDIAVTNLSTYPYSSVSVNTTIQPSNIEITSNKE